MIPPRGYRNKNPGNLRPLAGTETYEGQTGIDHDPEFGSYCIFADAQHGIRGIVRVLLTYQSKDKCKSVADIINRWAPPADKNPTGAYVTNVARTLGVEPTAPFKLTSENALPFVHAIITQELGDPAPYGVAQWYPDNIVAQGIALAF